MHDLGMRVHRDLLRSHLNTRKEFPRTQTAKWERMPVGYKVRTGGLTRGAEAGSWGGLGRGRFSPSAPRAQDLEAQEPLRQVGLDRKSV